MFKRFTLLLFTLLSCHLLFSQDQWVWDLPTPTHEKGYSFAVGLKAGGGLSMGSDPTLYNIDINNGLAYQAGVALNLHFGRRHEQSPRGTGWIGAQVEVLFGSRDIRSYSRTLSLRCLEIPVLVQFYPTPSFAIEAGCTFVKTLKCVPEMLQLDDMVFQTGGISGGDIMITLGLAYQLSNGLSFGIRYNYGTSDVAGNFDCKTDSLLATIAYMFSIIK